LVIPERLEEGGVTIIVAASQDETTALDVFLHDLKHLPHLVISLFLSIANIGDSEERLGPAKATGKLGKGGVVGDLKNARGEKGPGETF
jgi:hypothetical protein